MQDIIRGYRKLAQLDLPPGAAHLFADVRNSIVDMEKLILDAKLPKPRPWLCPFVEEQRDWESLYPSGGFLLRRQMCMASSGDEDWSIGCLFISDLGIAFDSADIADDESSFDTGFIQWKDIDKLVKGSGPQSELILTLVRTSEHMFKSLRLQLSISADAEWLEEFWSLRAGKPRRQRLPTWTVPAEEGIGEIPNPVAPRLLVARADGISKKVLFEQEETLPVKSVSQTVLSSKSQRLRFDSTVSNAFANTSAGQAPSGHLPTNQTPACTQTIPDLSLSLIRAALEDKNCILEFLKQNANAYEMDPTYWSESKRVKGTMVRRVHFKMPLPKDVPKAISRLISLPDVSSATAVYRLRATSDSITLTNQTCTHDVTFGENFRVQETIAFSEAAHNQIELKKWVEIIWVAPLPWAYGAIRSYIEKKSKADSIATVGAFVALIRQVGKSLSTSS